MFSDAYDTGFEAAAQGKLRSENPYSSITWDSGEWFNGFDDSQDEKAAVKRHAKQPIGRNSNKGENK